MKKKLPFILLLLIPGMVACGQVPTSVPVDRYSLMPAVKYGPESDFWPPIIREGWSQPVPLPFPVNTKGGEDSPFLLPDGNTLYFFFTPDVSLPAEKQLLDGVTGIWVTRRNGESWSEPQRVLLSKPRELALDGCEFVSGDMMYFCTTREGYTGIQWFRADLVDGTWQDWRSASDELKLAEYETGELHISADGKELFFHSTRPGGLGGRDIWISTMTAAGWGEPVNAGAGVNTETDEGWPYVSPDGKELWFNRNWSIFRCLRQEDGTWEDCQEIISQLAGEPTLSADGKTLYFVHHYLSEDLKTILEADIYVSYREE